MFNERVLEFEGGAFIPCRKGAQPKNRTKINERHCFDRCMIAVALGHCDKCTQRTHSTSRDMQPTRPAKCRKEDSARTRVEPFNGGALAKPRASA